MRIITVLQIVFSVIVIALILVQQRSADAGGLFGGGGGGGFYQQRRGLERTIFISTIVATLIFIGLSLANLLL